MCKIFGLKLVVVSLLINIFFVNSASDSLPGVHSVLPFL